MESQSDRILQALTKAKDLLEEFTGSENVEKIAHFANKIAETVLAGNKILSCGNGGSMCDAMHFAEELTGRFRKDRPSLPAIAISDPSHLSCTANDYGYDFVFSRYIEGVGKPGDLLVCLSTSGNSQNIYNAVRAAKEAEIYSVALLGQTGGSVKPLADHFLLAPGETSDRIQELHIKIIHIAIEMAEESIRRHRKG